MHKRFIYDENHRPIRQTPILEMPTRTTLGVLDLDYENTKLRRFGEGCEHMNHVEYRNRKRVLTGIFLDQFVDPDVDELLIEHGFPQDFEPFPPPEEFAWFKRAFLIRHNIALDSQEVAAQVEPEIHESVNEAQPKLIELAASGVITGVAVVTAIGSILFNKK